MSTRLIPLATLHSDRAECIADIAVCVAAMSYGVHYHSDGFPVSERIAENHRMIRAIDHELQRREIAAGGLLAVSVHMALSHAQVSQSHKH
jgi:hypothetical protein